MSHFFEHVNKFFSQLFKPPHEPVATGAYGGFDSETERKLHDILVDRNKKMKKRPTIEAIVMRFGQLDKAFLEIRTAFQKYDADHSGSIDTDEMRKCLIDLHVNMTDEEVDQLYKEADMDAQNGIQFKEFILAMAFMYLLKPESDVPRFGKQYVSKAFETIVEAFLLFDRDGDGYVTKDEVLAVFQEKGEGGVSKTATDRFAEMDFNTDGKCSFREFLHAFVGWVGTAEDDDEEDEEVQHVKEEKWKEFGRQVSDKNLF